MVSEAVQGVATPKLFTASTPNSTDLFPSKSVAMSLHCGEERRGAKSVACLMPLASVVMTQSRQVSGRCFVISGCCHERSTSPRPAGLRTRSVGAAAWKAFPRANARGRAVGRKASAMMLRVAGKRAPVCASRKKQTPESPTLRSSSICSLMTDSGQPVSSTR